MVLIEGDLGWLAPAQAPGAENDVEPRLLVNQPRLLRDRSLCTVHLLLTKYDNALNKSYLWP